MNTSKKLLTLSVALFAVVFFAGQKAYATASLPSCLTPQGSVKVTYSNGEHGIVGDTSIKTGSDTVYSLGSDNLQCFCGSNGAGVQTNWIDASEMSGDQIKIYQNQGYKYISSGEAWGLSDHPYLALNSTYSCGGGTSTVQGSSGGDGKSDGRSDGRSDGGSSSSFVQPATGNIALASTGDIISLITIAFLSALSLFMGVYLRKKVN